MHAATVVIGDKLGLYKALADQGPVTGAELAEQHRLRRPAGRGVAERAVRERLLRVRTRQRHVPADRRAGRRARRRLDARVPRRGDDDRGGDLQGRGEHPQRLRHRQGARLARAQPRPVPRHRAAVQARLPGQPGRRPGSRRSTASRPSCGQERKVADIGCGHGSSTILLAQQYPESEIVGFDYHEGSIETARKRAAEAGVADRVRFEVASRAGLPGRPTTTSCASSTRCTTWATRWAPLATSATRWPTTAPGCSSSRWRSVGSRTTSIPSSRIFYAGAVGICTPAAEAQAGGFALGNQVERRTVGGSCSARRATPASAGPPRPRSTGCSRCGSSDDGTCGRVASGGRARYRRRAYGHRGRGHPACPRCRQPS